MNLSSLSLLDLQSLNDVLSTLDECGALMVEHGFHPLFSLAPGLPVTMTLGPLFDGEAASTKGDVPSPTPPFTGLASQTEDFGPRLGWDEYDREVRLLSYTGGAHSLGAWGELTLSASLGGRVTELRTYRAVEPWHGFCEFSSPVPFGAVRIRDPETGWTADLPIEPLPEVAVDTAELKPLHPAPGEDGGEVQPAHLPVEPEQEMLGAEQGGVQRHLLADNAPVQPEAPDAVDPPPSLSASGVSGQARPVAPPAALTEKFKPASWTAEEDASAIRIAADVFAKGGNIREAATAVCTSLGRPFEGTKFRLLNKLKDPIAAELAQRRSAAIRREPAPQDDAPLVAIPPQGSDALTVHLLGVPRKGGWTMAQDQQLMDLVCAGWGGSEIAADMGLSSAKDVKTRFDLLTGLTETLDGNKKRTFERDLVRLRLDDLMAEAKINLVVAAMQAGTAAAE